MSFTRSRYPTRTRDCPLIEGSRSRHRVNEPDGARSVEIALGPERRPAEIDEQRRAGEPALVLLEAPIRVEEEDGVVAVDREALDPHRGRDELAEDLPPLEQARHLCDEESDAVAVAPEVAHPAPVDDADLVRRRLVARGWGNPEAR